MFTIELLNEGRDETWRTLVIDLRENLEAIITTFVELMYLINRLDYRAGN